MPPSPFKKPLAFATVLAAAGVFAVGALPTGAGASYGGSLSSLTSSNRSTLLSFENGGKLSPRYCEDPCTAILNDTVIDASWSPDGSRAVFVDVHGAISTARYNDGDDRSWLTFDADADDVVVTRSEPTWRGPGTVVWAESNGSRSTLQAVDSSGAGLQDLFSPDNTTYSYTHPDGNAARKVVYQRNLANGSGTPEIWVNDPTSGDTLITANAANPAISPDGTKVAFVRGGQIWVTDLSGNNPVQVTSNAVSHDNPVWSPDGGTIAFTNGSGVATAPANGSNPDSPTVKANLSSSPAYQPSKRNTVARLQGSDRFGTAVAVSQSHWATTGQADARATAQSVVLSRSDNFADALGGSALAAAKQGPLLMTPPTSLNGTTKAEISRLLAPGSTVYLLGSTASISGAVEQAIKDMGFTTVRLAGTDRYSTSVAIAKAIDPSPDLVLAATGKNFPDALSAGAAAGSYNLPGTGMSAVVVLTADDVLPGSVKTFIDGLPAATRTDGLYGIGGKGEAALAPYIPWSVSGSDRYETAWLTAMTFFGGQTVAGVATGTNWPDALAGGALLGTLNGPLLLTPGASSTLHYVPEFLLTTSSGSTETALIFGSAGAVNGALDSQIGTLISGPGGFDAKTNPTTLGMAVRAAGKAVSALVIEVSTLHRTPAELAAALKAAKDVDLHNPVH